MSEISDISDLMASNDPMATPVMSLGPPPPQNTSPHIQGENVAQMHEQHVAMAHQADEEPVAKPKPTNKSKLTVEQRVAIVVGCCAFIILLPNVQQVINQRLPVLTSNSTLQVLANSAFIGLLFFVLREHIMDLI